MTKLSNIMPKTRTAQQEKAVLHYYVQEGVIKGSIYDPIMKKNVKYHLRCSHQEAMNHVAQIRNDDKENAVEFQFVIHNKA